MHVNRWFVGLGAVSALSTVLGAGMTACSSSSSSSPPAHTADSGSSACSAPFVSCAAGCADTRVDPGNCGKCGNVCADGMLCANGACVTSCATGSQPCPVGMGMGCIDVQEDQNNCGACGNACAAGLSCTAGSCGVACTSGLTLCTPAAGGQSFCANTQTDGTNCGTCGNLCGPGATCGAGHCVAGCATGLALCPAFDGFDAGSASPDGGTEDASTDARFSLDAFTLPEASILDGATRTPLTCVDFEVDDRNCGACGVTCSGGQYCKTGVCSYATSCVDLLQSAGPLPDGTYTIQPFGLDGDAGVIRPFAVYCAGMSTPAPKEYLSLAHSALTNEPSSNFSMSAGGGACSSGGTPCGDDYSQFTKVRLLVPSLQVDTTDRTFAFHRDPSVDACWQAVGGACGALWETQFADATDCAACGAASGQADVDLRDTGFTLDGSVTFVPSGTSASGTSSFDADRTTVDLTGGGCCGSNAAPNGLLQLRQQ